jgi:hypothetical protein
MTAQVQNAGLARITATLLALSWWMGWGTGSAAVRSANDLVAAAPEGRIAATVAQGMVAVSNDSLILTATITALAARAITEVGAFDATTSGNLDLYSDFAVINVKAGDSIAYTIRLTFS